MSDIRVASGHLFFFFAYDVGFDISLQEAARLSEASTSPGVAGLRPVPQHLRYHPKPLLLASGPVELHVGTSAVRLEASAKIFDFGALSVVLCLPARDMPWDEYVRTGLLLAGERGIEEAAREIASRLFERIRPAVTRSDFADIVEDYSVWHVGAFAPEMTGSEALARLPQDIARLLTLEQGTFSGEALADILRNPIRYFENDLILAAWDAAFAYDRKFQDTVEVLEFLNVQMLELRFFDRVLHAAIDEMGDELHKRRKLLSLLHDPYEKPLRKLSEIKMDVSMVRERIDNALKVAGDAYLARVYDEARRKVGTEKWEGTIRDQLKTLEDIYTILNNRAAAARAETLEVIIILLIALEIVMGLLRH
ncbi:MAG: hypothetical protein XU12_C0014G0030 [Deltaproteobacteria bacterium CSP1-8]|nr:MAG: hypothetical protein XU12_C0014G0030 [Deltaproteobacteria bacterium CSP1-8]